MKLLITGATGAAGLNIYRAALQDPSISAVTLLMRREMPSWAALPPNAAEKTTTIVHTDFTQYPPALAARLAEHDACIWALGTSAVGMSEADYARITVEYPLAALRALRDAGVAARRAPGDPFRFVYVSGASADTTEQSMRMYVRVKGHAENEVAAFCTPESGIMAHNIRPAYFRPSREHPEDWAHQRSRAQNVLDRAVLTPVLGLFLPSYIMPLAVLSRVPLETAKGRWPDVALFTNQMMLDYGKEIGV
ncbi:hypothetical protein PsYK624_025340 [Phanerochaete sordida]|uniref:NAD(P)-binding domain-containing protein n=1 Tax=Phanerochaete sordida TaxID=48140 RepID=A0A9P3L9F0_9APHY|nr:hypothetical protein PsYK624_025340 [Phanerochaete sordida]